METKVKKNKKKRNFVHLWTKVENGQYLKKIYCFYFRLILTLSDNDLAIYLNLIYTIYLYYIF